jgi:hypothetical protein
MRSALIAIALCLVVGVVTWNVVFDRAIQSAEQRYLALQRQHVGAVTIREVMDPAIHDAAAAATAWAAALAGAGLPAAFIVRHKVQRRRRQTVAPRV